MNRNERHLRSAIRGILQEADRQTTPIVNVQQVGKTYQPIGLPSPTTFVALGAITALSKVYSFISCEKPPFPGENLRQVYESLRELEDDAAASAYETKLAEAAKRDFVDLQNFYNQATRCALAWVKTAVNANYFFKNNNAGAIVTPTQDLVGMRCPNSNVGGQFIDSQENPGPLFERVKYIKFIRSFVDAAHNDFVAEVSEQRKDFVDRPEIFDLYGRILAEETDRYNRCIRTIN